MSIYEYADPAVDEVMRTFWSLVPVVAEQGKVTEADAVAAMRRELVDRAKALKLTHGVDYADDGRAALWRVRLTVWNGLAYDNCIADTDPERPPTDEGATLIAGLPAVAAWARELIEQLHPGRELDGIAEHVLANKIKSLRVALSTQNGSCVWRLRYTVQPEKREAGAPLQRTPGSLRGVSRLANTPEHLMAIVRVSREEGSRRQ